MNYEPAFHFYWKSSMPEDCGTFDQRKLRQRQVLPQYVRFGCTLPDAPNGMEHLSLSAKNIHIIKNIKKWKTCPVANPTTKSAINVSSVSPERWETITPQPLLRASFAALIDSVTEPIWLTFKSKQLHDFFSIAVWIRFGFVTVKSSPTSLNFIDIKKFSRGRT